MDFPSHGATGRSVTTRGLRKRRQSWTCSSERGAAYPLVIQAELEGAGEDARKPDDDPGGQAEPGDGILVVDGYDKFKTFLGKDMEPGKSGDDGVESGEGMARGAGGTDGHIANFIDAVRAHDKSMLNGPVETAHLSSGLAHLGNIAYRLGRVLTFDPASEKFVDDREADKMLTRKYRPPYIVPEKV